VTLAAMGEETPEVVRKRIDEIQTNIHKLDLMISMNDLAYPFTDEGELVGADEEINYKAMTHQERKEALKSLVQKIVLESNGNFDITLKNHPAQQLLHN
jgi:galactitol-specific phosphotransferase system IIB component